MFSDDFVWALGARGELVPAIRVSTHDEKMSMPGTSSAKTRFALLPGHDDFVERLLAKEAANS